LPGTAGRPASDARQNLGYDLRQNLQLDIATVREGIGTVQGDLRSLSPASLPAPANAGNTISAARAAIRHAVAVTDSDIATVNADVDLAYAIAQGMATVSCAGPGPDLTPAPIEPLG